MILLNDVLKEVSRREEVEDKVEYSILGVKWYAEGAWLKYNKLGSDIKAKYLYKVRTGDIIYNRLFAWKGSFAVITDELDGCYVSNEFPDIRQTPIPLWELAPMKKYVSMNVQYSRGCPFNCEFCDITVLYGQKVRTKDKEQILKPYYLPFKAKIFGRFAQKL